MSSIGRRGFIGKGLTALLATNVIVKGQTLPRAGNTSNNSSLPALVVEINFPGGAPVPSITFDIRNGKDMGNYISPSGKFTQRCIRVHNMALPNFFVDFRPDVGSDRVEVVFWNGEVFGSVASGHSRDLPAYDCVIKKAGAVIYTLGLPFHYWGCRWRYQSARRSSIRNPSQIFSEGWLPPMSARAARLDGYKGIIVPPAIPALTNNPCTGNPPWTPFDPPNGKIYKNLTLASGVAAGATSVAVSGGTVDRGDRVAVKLGNNHWQTFMSAGLDGATTFKVDKPFSFAAGAGAIAKVITYDMNLLCNNDGGGGGPGRPEEGLITDSQAEYLLTTGDRQAGAFNTMMAQAEMCASQWNSMFLPDSVTGAPVNYKQDAAHYGSYTRNSIGIGPYGSYYLIRGGAINTLWNNSATEHMANYFYVPYAVTDDAYFAEAMQFAVQWDKGYDIYNKENAVGRLASDRTGNSCIVGPRGLWSYQAEPRNIGWGVRNTAVAWKSAPSAPPSWLQPQGYFATIGQDEAKLIDMKLTTSTDTLQTVFRNPCNNDFVQVFETSYFLLSIALADQVGLPHGSGPSWKKPLTYFFDQITQLTNGKSGWNRQCPQITNEDPNTGVLRFSSIRNPSGHYRNWGEVWAARGATAYQIGEYAHDPEPRCQQSGSSMQNISIMVAAAGAAKSRGVSDAAAAFDWLNALIDDSYPARLIYVQFEMKWGFSGT